ncbi:hypothetical protein SUGI_0725070 [Cryptomeria japonica]|nr:hypothetical protein SUGI_0725070 [Cryptomeria japonica]
MLDGGAVDDGILPKKKGKRKADTVFLSPVVVYTGFFLTALLSIGHRQQQEKVAALEKNKGVVKEGMPLNEVCQLRSLSEETITGFSSGKYDEYAEESIVSEKIQEEEFNGGFVDGMEINSREMETEVYENRSLDLSNEEIRAPDFQKDQNRAKSVHFSDNLIEGVYRTQLDVIMEENEEEERNHIEISTPRKIDSDSDDEAPMNVSPQSEDKEDQQQRKVRLEDFFSLTLNCESTWRSFGHHGASASNNSCTSDDDDDDDTDSSGSSEGSLGHLGPLLHIVDDPKHSHSVQSNFFVEDSLHSNGGGEESPVDFHFSWTEEDEREEKESLFEIVHAGDAQSMSEEDNLIEIALSDQENSELPEVQATMDQRNTEEQPLKAQEHREKDKFEGPEEENLIEIDLSKHSIGLPEEIEEKNLIQGELSDHSGDDPPVHSDPTPETESKLEEEIKAPEQNESSPTENPGKNQEEGHPQRAEIGEIIESSAESLKLESRNNSLVYL